mgnify:FL=1
MKSDNPSCSIIIRCYNEEEHIGRLLSGIMHQTIKDFEIILVDSGSTDATLSIASRYPVKMVYISPEEFSFGRALNKGCEAAEGEFLVFISAHCWPVYEDWLETLTKPFQDSDVALVYGKQRGNEITKFTEHQIFLSWFPDISNLDQKTPFCNNANCAIRKKVWEKIPYNEELTGLEDLDWAKRALEAGYKIAYSSEAEIIHVHEETPRRIYNRYRREAIALKKIYPNEHFTILDFIRSYLTNISADCLKAAKEHVFMQNIKGITIFRLMQFGGAYKGFRERDHISKTLKRTFYYPKSLKKSLRPDPKQFRGGYIDYSHLESVNNNEENH